MSGNLGKLGSTSQSAFSKMSQYAEQAKGKNKILGQSYDELQKRIRETENTIKSSTITSQISAARRELASLQRMAGKHSGNLSGGSSGKSSGGFSVGGMAVGSMLGGFATQAGTAILGVMKDGVGAAISGSIKKEQQIVGLQTFLGKEGANEAYENIKQDASISPFNTDSLLSVNRSLISAGLNAKDAREDSMNLANAISAVGGGNAELDRMAANMQQIKTVGKATAMDIRQFGMVGINIYEMLSRSTGKSIDKVKEMDVSYDDLAKSLAMARSKDGIYEGALEAMGQTRGAKLEQVQDKFGMALTDIGDAFSPVINKVLDVAVKIADSISPLLEKAQPYIDMISNGLGEAIDYVLSLSSGTGEWIEWIEIAQNYYEMVWVFLKSIFSSVAKIVSGLVQWIAKSEIIKDVIKALQWLLSGVLDIVGWIGEELVKVWDEALKPMLDGIEEAYKWVKGLFSDDDNQITVEAKKTIINKDEQPTSYNADLTRFKNKGLITDTEDKKKKNKESSRKAGDTISGGGAKNITINLQKFFDTIQFTTMNNNESREEIEKLLMELMGRVLYNGAKN